MSISRCAILPCAGVLALSLASCGGGLKAGAPTSPTGGIAIEVLRSDGRSSHALYRVDPDGTLSFGGGFDATTEYVTNVCNGTV